MAQVPSVPADPSGPDKFTISDFPVLWPVGTRWADNDMFGHLNNAVYYELFDTAINAWINTSTDVDPVTAPWLGVDPIVTSAQIVLGLQTVVSRTLDLNREPAVVTIGAIKGGVRENIIPDSVEMRGTIRTFDEEMRDEIHERVTTLAESVAIADA